MQLKKILVPYDFSDHSKEALDWALELADTWQARVELLHVIHILPPVVDIPSDMYADVERDQIADAQQRLEALRTEKTSDTPATIDIHVQRGVPFQAICDYAETHQADMIVMGSHGRTGLSHVFLGSVAERVIRHAPCPVLVTKHEAVA